MTGKAVNIRRARPDDAGVLADIAFAAKSHWGYPMDWIRRWEEALTVTPDYVRRHPTFCAVEGSTIGGFYALQVQADGALLDHLWVLPSEMGRGIGRALFAHAEGTAREGGAVRLKIVGDPNAEGFYRRMGATIYGSESAMMDERPRSLPLLEKILR